MYRKNTASQYVYFCLVNSSTGAALTGATVTAYRALDNAAQATATGTTTELANGQYRYNLSQADTNANNGSYLFTASGAVPVEKTVVFTTADPTDAAGFGLTRIDATIGTRATQTSVDTIDDFLDTEIAAIKAKTDNLPSDPADASEIAAFFVTVNTKLDTIDDLIDTEVAAIFNRLGAPAGASISADVAALLSTTEDVNATVNSIATNALTQSDIRTAVGLASANLDTQLSAIDDFLDTEIAAIKVATDRFLTMIVLDGAVYQFTANAVELAPAGGGGGGGTGDASQATLLAVKAKTDLITAGNVSYSGPVTATGKLEKPVIIGDDYLAANGRAFTWTISAISGITPGTATVRFAGKSRVTASNTFAVTGTVTDLGTGKWTLSCDMSRTVSGNLVAGGYDWSVEITSSGGTEVTPVRAGSDMLATTKF